MGGPGAVSEHLWDHSIGRPVTSEPIHIHRGWYYESQTTRHVHTPADTCTKLVRNRRDGAPAHPLRNGQAHSHTHPIAPLCSGLLGRDHRDSATNPRGRDETPGPHAPCVQRGCVNEYSHLLNGSAEACLQPPRVGDASVMLNEDMGSSGNHFR